jgi:hypothetical protein
MSSDLKKYWEKKTYELRQSMPEIRNKEYTIDEEEEGESYISKINRYLNQYDEIKQFCRRTKIKPFYYLVFLMFSLCFILIGYFDKYLTLILATIYPLFMTFKSLKYYDVEDEENRTEVIHWLKYWIFYSVFINIESLFGNFFKRFYFIFKIIILLNCFPINSKLTTYIYQTCENIYLKYESFIKSFFKNVYDHLTETQNEIKAKGKKIKAENQNEIANLGVEIIKKLY